MFLNSLFFSQQLHCSLCFFPNSLFFSQQLHCSLCFFLNSLFFSQWLRCSLCLILNSLFFSQWLYCSLCLILNSLFFSQWLRCSLCLFLNSHCSSHDSEFQLVMLTVMAEFSKSFSHLGAVQIKIQRQKCSKEHLFILTRTRSMQNFGEIPFIKPRNDT